MTQPSQPRNPEGTRLSPSEADHHVEAVEQRIADFLRYHGGGSRSIYEPELVRGFQHQLCLTYGFGTSSPRGIEINSEGLFECADGTRIAAFSVVDRDGRPVLPERRDRVLSYYACSTEAKGVFLEHVVSPVQMLLTSESGDPAESRIRPVVSPAALDEMEEHKMSAILRLKAERFRGVQDGYPVEQPSFMVYLLLHTVTEAVRERVLTERPNASPPEWTPIRIDDVEPEGSAVYHVTVTLPGEGFPMGSLRRETHTVGLYHNPFFGTLRREWLGMQN